MMPPLSAKVGRMAYLSRYRRFDDGPMLPLYDVVMRTIVELPESQVEALSVLCRRERISRAEAIRRAVAKLLDDEKATSGGMAGAFGLWKGRTAEVRKLREDLREEWR